MSDFRSQPKTICGRYERFCTVILGFVSLWLLVAVGAMIIPIIVYLHSGKVLEW